MQMYVQRGYDSGQTYNYYSRYASRNELLNDTNAGYPGRWVYQTERSRGIESWQFHYAENTIQQHSIDANPCACLLCWRWPKVTFPVTSVFT